MSEGFHRITVYAGWQYLGIPERFEVTAYATVEFIVGNPESTSPAPTQTPSTSSTPLPTFSPIPILPTPTATAILTQVSSDYPLNQMFLITMAMVITIGIGLLVYFKKRKH